MSWELCMKVKGKILWVGAVQTAAPGMKTPEIFRTLKAAAVSAVFFGS